MVCQSVPDSTFSQPARYLLPDGAPYTFERGRNTADCLSGQKRQVQLAYEQVDGFMKRVPVADILWLFLGTRLLLVAVTYFSYILFPVPPHLYPNTGVDVVGLL